MTHKVMNILLPEWISLTVKLGYPSIHLFPPSTAFVLILKCILAEAQMKETSLY